MGAEVDIQVIVAYAPAPRQVQEVVLRLSIDATVGQALIASGLSVKYPEIDAAPLGVWGRKATHDQILRAGDRVEIYRNLRVDPKVARRERFARQGAGRSGLFAQRRTGAKSGY